MRLRTQLRLLHWRPRNSVQGWIQGWNPGADMDGGPVEKSRDGEGLVAARHPLWVKTGRSVFTCVRVCVSLCLRLSVYFFLFTCLCASVRVCQWLLHIPRVFLCSQNEKTGTKLDSCSKNNTQNNRTCFPP